MMIKITEHCSMECSHCMNNATPNNRHMDFDTFRKAIDFQKKYGGPFVIITGGEPTEHPEFEKFLGYAAMYLNTLNGVFITVTTNGIWMQDNEKFIRDLNYHYKNTITFQVTSDKRYYPTLIDLSLPVFHYDNVVVCDKIEQVYPQGRAIDNNLEWKSKASKCFNVRAITNQIEHKDLRTVIGMLTLKGKFCTPHISINGDIKLGESDLCPSCSHIDKSNNEIINDIINFRCNGCNIVNSSLPDSYRKLIGE